jgi:hypothetical protein
MADTVRAKSGRFASTITDDNLLGAYRERPSARGVAVRLGLSVSTVRARLAAIRERMGDEEWLAAIRPDIDREATLEQLIRSAPKGADGAKLRELSVSIWGMGAKNRDTQKIETRASTPSGRHTRRTAKNPSSSVHTSRPWRLIDVSERSLSTRSVCSLSGMCKLRFSQRATRRTRASSTSFRSTTSAPDS